MFDQTLLSAPFPSASDRAAAPSSASIYDDGYLRVEHENYHVACGGKTVKMGRSEFLIVSFLARRADRFATPEAIWQHLWQTRKPVNLDSLHVLIYRLRRKFEVFGVEIETMVNVGYKLVPFKPETVASLSGQINEQSDA
jgi:DNA-binding response OmpR family regulator